MNAKRSQAIANLPREARLCVLFARQANSDTWNGGARALVKVERSKVSNRRLPYRLSDVVSEVYGRSSGKVPDHLDAFECNECGQVHFGRDAAENCCNVDAYEELDEQE